MRENRGSLATLAQARNRENGAEGERGNKKRKRKNLLAEGGQPLQCQIAKKGKGKREGEKRRERGNELPSLIPCTCTEYRYQPQPARH
jgi:hypothetical protein